MPKEARTNEEVSQWVPMYLAMVPDLSDYKALGIFLGIKPKA